jgi:hypothetical protein
MGRQTGVVVGFLDEVFSCGALVVEPDQQIQRVVHVGHEDPVDVLVRIEELIMFRRFVLFCTGIAQRQEACPLLPSFGLIEKLALLVGIGPGRRLPLRHL